VTAEELKCVVNDAPAHIRMLVFEAQKASEKGTEIDGDFECRLGIPSLFLSYVDFLLTYCKLQGSFSTNGHFKFETKAIENWLAVLWKPLIATKCD